MMPKGTPLDFDGIVADLAGQLADGTGLGIAMYRAQTRVLLDGIQAMMRDAKRYRWMRKQEDVDVAACWLLPPDVSLDIDDLNTPEQLDAAIDREIGASSKPQVHEQGEKP